MIGAGGIAGAHLPAWLGLDAQVTIYSWEGAPELAARSGSTAVESLEALLDRCDIVDVCTPTPFHREYIEAAAAAGKHVLSEKPIGRTSGDARAAIEACRTAGVQLYPGHVVRFFSEFETMHREVAAGTIGDIAVQRFTRTGSRPEKAWFHDEEQSGGIILDQMVHDLDFARWNAGEVQTAFARLRKNGDGLDAVTAAQVVLTHTTGAISYVGGTWARPGTTLPHDLRDRRNRRHPPARLHRAQAGRDRPGHGRRVR
jgi:myo-inositol 2-dehydrogenase/D-chiro-inositol 1-dehydrogenase